MNRCLSGHLLEDSSRRRRLPMLLRRAWFNLNQSFRRSSAQHRLTPDQFTVLRTLHEQSDTCLTQQELANLMSSDANTITSLLRRMEARGWVVRPVDPSDRRARRLALTDKGRAKYVELRPMALALQSQVLAALPEERRAAFLRDLEIIAEACHRALTESRE